MEKLKEFLINYSSKYQEEYSKLPHYINVIDSATRGERLKETAHSQILVNLLKEESILKSFIDYFFSTQNFSLETANKQIDIAAEKGRIDVSIECKREYFIIIENKANDAAEQKGQIYRYYKTAEDLKYNNDQIFVLYLNSDNYEEPSLFSLCKGGDKNKNNIKEELENRLIVKNYRNDILPWLKDKILPNIKNKDFLLLSAVHQYIDYLENKFKISKRYDNMNNELNKLIRGYIDNEKMNLPGIENLKNKLEEIISSEKLNDIKKQYDDWGKVLSEKYFTPETKQYDKDVKPFCHPNFRVGDWPKIGVEIQKDDIKFAIVIDGQINKDYQISNYTCGFMKVDGDNEDTRKFIVDNIANTTELSMIYPSDEYYYAKKNGTINELIQLIDSVIENLN